jgi:hypothetical protein
MFFDQQSGTAFGSLGWVEKGSFWLWDQSRRRERRIAVPGTRWVSVGPHGGGFIRVSHHGAVPKASLRACTEPEIELAAIEWRGSAWRLSGDSRLWGRHLAILLGSEAAPPSLLVVDGEAGSVKNLDLSWFNAEDYDLGYQGVVGCLAMPEAGVVLVSVQRSSTLVMLDPDRNEVAGRIRLSDRAGNPRLKRISDTQVLVSDYDAVCIVDLTTGTRRCSDVLQPPEPPTTRQFIGDYDLNFGTFAVARPFSGDVLRLDPADLSVRESSKVGGRPLSLCMTSETSFLTRDWKTGRMRLGSFG